MKVTLLGGPSP